MYKKVVVLPILAFIIIVLGVILLSNKDVSYSDNPKTFVDKKIGSIVEVNVDKVTKGDGFMDYLGQQYDDGSVQTVFTFDGIYKGNIFKDEYMDEQGNILIKISRELNPDDGVLDGFLVERIKDNVPHVFIFLDKDWKDAVGDRTNILWGENYQKILKYNFDEISDGIYIHKIKDDLNRFDNNFKESSGGILVGDITLDNVENNDLSNVIIIRMS